MALNGTRSPWSEDARPRISHGAFSVLLESRGLGDLGGQKNWSSEVAQLLQLFLTHGQCMENQKKGPSLNESGQTIQTHKLLRSFDLYIGRGGWAEGEESDLQVLGYLSPNQYFQPYILVLF